MTDISNLSADPSSAAPIDNPNLPSTRALLTNIITHLSTFHPPTDSTTTTSSSGSPRTLASLSIITKPLLLTLHSLLPHCLLPALDLLDRGLVERWIPAVDNDIGAEEVEEDNEGNDSEIPHSTSSSSFWVYYIQSKPPHPQSQATLSSLRPNPASTSVNTYEVRPSIWHCSCANFAFYAFATVGSQSTNTPSLSSITIASTGEASSWIWGTSHLSPSHPPSIPVCKHLLAAVLAEQCPSLFGGYVKERKGVRREEMVEKACWWD